MLHKYNVARPEKLLRCGFGFLDKIYIKTEFLIKNSRYVLPFFLCALGRVLCGKKSNKNEVCQKKEQRKLKSTENEIVERNLCPGGRFVIQEFTERCLHGQVDFQLGIYPHVS